MPNKHRAASSIDPRLRAVLAALCKGEAPWPLFLYGPPGTGKTCAALALLDHSGGHYWTPSELCQDLILASKGQLHYATSGRPVLEKALWREIGERPLVVLDELGARSKVSDYQYEQIKRVLDLREGLPLLAVSNLDLDGLALVYDDRIASRLAAGTMFRLDGADQRLRR